MANDKKAKRPGWQPPPPKSTTPPGMEVCSVCKRLFRPKPENKTGTCINCQKGYTTAAKQLTNMQALQMARQSFLSQNEADDPTELPAPEKRLCMLCKKEFWSKKKKAYNQICKACRKKIADAPTCMDPYSTGRLD